MSTTMPLNTTRTKFSNMISSLKKLFEINSIK
jgi:hypothetical protein